MKDAKEFSQRLKNLVMATAFSVTGTPQTELDEEVEAFLLDARIAGLVEAASISEDTHQLYMDAWQRGETFDGPSIQDAILTRIAELKGE